MKSFFKLLLKFLLWCYHCRRSARLAQHGLARNERPVEYSYALSKLYLASGNRVLDVGARDTAFSSLLQDCGCEVTAVDKYGGLWGRQINLHINVQYDDITQSKLSPESFDVVTCISVLEHIPDADMAVAEMTRLLKPGGILILTFPYCERNFVENAYTLNGCSVNPNQVSFGCAIFCRKNVAHWIRSNGLKLVDQVYYRCWDGEYWRVGKRLPAPVAADASIPHNLSCLVFRKAVCE